MAGDLFKGDQCPFTVPAQDPQTSNHDQRIVREVMRRPCGHDDLETLNTFGRKCFVAEPKCFQAIQTGEDELNPNPFLPLFVRSKFTLKAFSMTF